jgi:hypothetical protein
LTISSTVTRIQYQGNGTTTGFGFPLVFLAPADIGVLLWDTLGLAPVASRLNGGGSNDYTVAGTQDPNTGEYLSGATVNFNTAPLSSWTVTLWRNEPLTQNVNFAPNGPLTAPILDTALDKACMIDQYLNDQLQRAIIAPVTDPPPPGNPNMTLPSVAVRAGQLLGFDALGQPSVGPNQSLLESLIPSGLSASLQAIDWVATISAVRALTPPVAPAPIGVLGYNNIGDKQPVIYNYSLVDSRADDGGLVIKPASVSGGSPGRWILATQGAPFNVLDWGADPTNSTASDTAFSNWFAALIAQGAEGYVPAGHYKFASAQVWNIAAVAGTGITIKGAGGERTILDFTAVSTNPALFVTGGGSVNFVLGHLPRFRGPGEPGGHRAALRAQ